MFLNLTLRDSGMAVEVPDTRLCPEVASDYWYFATVGFDNAVVAWCYAENDWAGFVSLEDIPGAGESLTIEEALTAQLVR